MCADVQEREGGGCRRSGTLACLPGASPSPRPPAAVQQPIEDALRRFPEAAAVDQALALLFGLGAPATPPRARRPAGVRFRPRPS